MKNCSNTLHSINERKFFIMTQGELVNKVSELTGESKACADRVLKGIVTAMNEALVAGDDVRLHGFGKFAVVDRAARVARSPRDGSEVQVPAKKAIKFTSSKTLKDSVNA